ncbi:MAG: hypothetical protein ACRDRG_08780 [Pseudonocardiaceae bacterium]
MVVTRLRVARHVRLPVCRALLVMALGAAAVIGVLPGSLPASAAPGDIALTDSADTKSGTGEFANLEVTVSQTKNLINQTVTVSWTGGVPTVPSFTSLGIHYLQIMQCWGDDPNGPDRTQCQYGALTQNSPPAGDWVRSRQATTTVVDPKETLKRSDHQNVHVPFWAVGTARPTDPDLRGASDYFGRLSTNEIPVARTGGDGTGLEFFEVQTLRQAPGLGCGAPVTTGGVTEGRSCWLVIVPRGNTEVDGTARTGENSSTNLDSSPLSQTNWDNRIVFPLEFLPVGQACPLGAPERRVIGHELAVDAVSRWQPALCAEDDTLYSYTQLSDDVTRNLLLEGSSPGLALMTDPIPTARAPPDRSLVYAPVALSGLAIAFNIEHQPPFSAPEADQLLNGVRFASMKLTPRLVAKLLTQSYRHAVAGAPDYLKNNPEGLTVDPEFLDLNPEYRGFATFHRPTDALVQLGGADVTSLLWSWVKADPDASAFLAGTPDQSGMMINPHNKDLALPTSTFPRNDQTCDNAGLCTLDFHPYANDMHDAGRSASRGDTQAQEPEVVNGIPGRRRADLQAPGRRAVLAVVDTATASRYSLPTAALRNAVGQFVTPTTVSLLAGAAAMKPSAVAGVLESDVSATDPAAYPLTALSYAVTSPSTLDAAAGKDYAALVLYAAGPGQQPGAEPGRLPAGMAPLPDALRAQAAAAAATIEAQAGTTSPGAPAQRPASAGPSLRTGSGGAAGSPGGPSTAATGGSGTTSGGGVGAPPAGGSSVAPRGAGGGAAETPSASQQPVASLRRTPATAIAAMGGLLLALLISGVLAAGLAPLAHQLGAPKRATRKKEVVPTEP